MYQNNKVGQHFKVDHFLYIHTAVKINLVTGYKFHNCIIPKMMKIKLSVSLCAVVLNIKS